MPEPLPRRTLRTKEDGEREDAIAKRFACAFGVTQVKIGADDPDKQKPRIDRAFVRDNTLVGLAEIKAHLRYGFRECAKFVVSKAKIEHGRSINLLLRVPVLLVIEFRCGTLAWINVAQPYEIWENWGRRDRGDPADLEAGACFSWSQFTIVKEAQWSTG